MSNNLLKTATKTIHETFWYEDLQVLYINNNFVKFFPTTEMNTAEKLNSIVRFGIYLGVLLILYTKQINYVYIPIFFFVITYFLHSNNNIISNFSDNPSTTKAINYVLPTIDNPFMNINFNDYKYNPTREAIIKKNNFKNPKLDKLINTNFNFNLYKDFSDIFGKNNSQRQFYTTPVTTIPNNQKGFSEWLYKTAPSCKEENGPQCYNNMYNDLKYS